MALRMAPATVVDPSIGRIWASRRSSRTVLTTAMKISRFDVKWT